MGHTHHRYDEFDEDIVRPLYGYVTDLKRGNVPPWVKKPRLSQDTVEALLGIDYDEYEDEIPRRDLPDGIKKSSGGRGPTLYKVDREMYLELRRQKVRESTDSGSSRFSRAVSYELNMRNSGVVVSHATGDGPTVPDEIIDRLNEVKDTARWDRKVDGYHVKFSKWELVYHLGPQGGIQDVHIEADLNR